MSLDKGTIKFLDKLKLDSGEPVFCWSSSELAKRLALCSQLKFDSIVLALRARGFQACVSGVMSGQIRTNASIRKLLQICKEIGH